MLIIPAFGLVMIFAVLMTAVLRPPARPAALVSLYLLAYADIVLVGEITNSFYQLNNAWLWLALHGLLAAAAWGIWRRVGKPPLRALWSDPEGRVMPAGWKASLKEWPDLWLLGLGVCLIFLFSLLLVWVVAPNNNDSLATHMSRVGYWLQRGAFFPWPSQRIWQITYPVDMQLQMFWTVLFLRADRIVEIVQWLGAVAALAAVFGLARLLGATRPQAFFAGLLLATFPEIILESTTTQNDLVAGTLFAAAFYLLFLGLSARSSSCGRSSNNAMLGLSGLALGLGMGTKQTLLFLLPGLGLTVGLAWLYAGQRALRPQLLLRPLLLLRPQLLLRPLLGWGISALAAFVLLSAYMYVVNQVNFGHPMGPETAVEAQTGGQTSQSLVENLTFNTFRLAYQMIDPTGLPDPLCGYAFKLKGLIFEKLTQAIHFPVESARAVNGGYRFVLRERYVMQEDAGWYGPLYALLGLPALFYQLVQGIRKKDALRVGIFLLAATFLLIDAAFRPGWDPFQGRYFIPVVMISAAYIGFAARPGRKMAVARWGIAILALVIAANTFLLGIGKPVSGEYAVWSTSRLDQMTIQSFYMRDAVHMVDANVPADSTLGLLTYGTFLEYPFFGENYNRKLVQIYPAERAWDIEWLKAQGIEYVLVLAPLDGSPVSLPADLVRVTSTERWSIFTWAGQK